MSEPMQPEDAKLVTLARGARSRVSAASGAAVRDETGRTYASAGVDLPSFAASGLVLAVAQAVASGARGIEAAAVVASGSGPEGLTELERAVLLEAGATGATVWCCAADGTVVSTLCL